MPGPQAPIGHHPHGVAHKLPARVAAQPTCCIQERLAAPVQFVTDYRLDKEGADEGEEPLAH